MKVPFLDLTRQQQLIASELNIKINEVINSGDYILSKVLEDFENNFSAFCKTKYALGVGNGLDALFLILKSLDIGEGDEVIVPSHTFIATWLAVSRSRATPVPVEIDEDTYNIDVEKLNNVISNKTKAIIPVHLYGQPADMDEINAFAKNHNLYVIEDAAQAHGAMYKDKCIGSLSNAAAFSFYPAKNLGAYGDGGSITTDSKQIKEKISKLRNYGGDKKYFSDIIGLNSRLDNLQAAILNVKLTFLSECNSLREKIANHYIDYISNKKIKLPTVRAHNKSAWHLFVIRTKNRDKLISHLENHDISYGIHYPIPPHKQLCYDQLGYNLSLTEKVSNEILSIPIFPYMTDNEVSYVIDVINKYQ
jgi:dTDP-4-amino-4,6-dideoxygalactose transaminase